MIKHQIRVEVDDLTEKSLAKVALDQVVRYHSYEAVNSNWNRFSLSHDPDTGIVAMHAEFFDQKTIKANISDSLLEELLVKHKFLSLKVYL